MIIFVRALSGTVYLVGNSVIVLPSLACNRKVIGD
jgi:hypothetical protein